MERAARSAPGPPIISLYMHIYGGPICSRKIEWGRGPLREERDMKPHVRAAHRHTAVRPVITIIITATPGIPMSSSIRGQMSARTVGTTGTEGPR